MFDFGKRTDPSWDLYRTLLAVLHHKSLSAAARSLDLTQPTVSRHIDTLEDAVGQKLFVRTQTGLKPTEVALKMKPYVENISAMTSGLLREAGDKGGEVSGTVRLSADEVFAVEVLPPILTSLKERYEKLTLELTMTESRASLLHREADIALRTQQPDQDGMVARKLGDMCFGLFAHRTYLARHGEPVRLAELKMHDLIGLDRLEPSHLPDLETTRTFDRADLTFRADSRTVKIAAIRAGLGIGICPVPLAQRDRNLKRLLPDSIDESVEVWAVMHEHLRATLRCQVVFENVGEGIKRWLV